MSHEIAAVREFNRFYTQRLGILDHCHLQSPFSLTEVRVLYELYHGEGWTAARLCEALGLDAGYLSRILRGFEKKDLIRRSASSRDRRASELELTAAGRSAFEPLHRKASEHVESLLRDLGPGQRARLVESMRAVQMLLGGKRELVLRTHEPGDLGWIVERHGVLYAREQGWMGKFESLVARVAADFLANYKPDRERCWLAELDGVRVGSVMLVEKSQDVAQLRLLLVEPEARGLGLGKRLVDECEAFARRVGYRRIWLWTQSGLAAARGIYKKAGYVVTEVEEHEHFGVRVKGEAWEKELSTPVPQR